MPILPEPETVVLDASALLAYLAGEAGADLVEIVLLAAARGTIRAVVPALSLSEALTIAAPALGVERIDDFRAAVEQLPVTTIPLDLDGALDAAVARLAWGLDLAEAAAAQAAQQASSILLTANPRMGAFQRAGGKVYWLGAETRRNELTLFDPLAQLRIDAASPQPDLSPRTSPG